MEVLATVRPLDLIDLPLVKSILEAWMRDEPGAPIRTDNVEEALGRMAESASVKETNSYMVVVDNVGCVVGVGGFTSVGIDELLTRNLPRPAELINVYVSEHEIGKGYGTLLVDELENRIRQFDCRHLIVVSGSRNRRFGYPFWDKRFGTRYRTDVNFFGPDTERVVWVKNLKVEVSQ